MARAGVECRRVGPGEHEFKPAHGPGGGQPAPRSASPVGEHGHGVGADGDVAAAGVGRAPLRRSSPAEVRGAGEGALTAHVDLTGPRAWSCRAFGAAGTHALQCEVPRLEREPEGIVRFGDEPVDRPRRQLGDIAAVPAHGDEPVVGAQSHE